MDVWGITALMTWIGMVAALVVIYGWINGGYRRSERKRFDERQLQAQGVAYKWGFLTGVFFLLGVVILRIFVPEPDYPLLTIVCIIVMLLVFVTIAVWKDAYIAIGEKESVIAVWFLVWGILKVIFSRGDLVELLTAGAIIYVACLIFARKEASREEDGF